MINGHGNNIYQFYDGDIEVDFSSNIAYNNHASKILEYLNQNLESLLNYPDPMTKSIREMIALSGVLDCRLGGPNKYFGESIEKPYIGVNPRELTHRDVIVTTWVNGKVAFISYII